MKSSIIMLDRGGKRAGNASDRRRVPPASEQRRLARRWNRRAADRRRHLLRFEAYNTWTGWLTGYPAPEEVIFAIDGIGEERHRIEGVRNAWSLMVALRDVGFGVLGFHARLTALLDMVVVRAHNYGDGLHFTNTSGLEWAETCAVTSGAADRMPAPFKVTGRRV